MYVDINYFLVVGDYLIECKIAPPDSSLEIQRLGGEEDIFLEQFLLLIGLRDKVVIQSKTFIGKTKLGTAKDGSDEHSKASEDQWQTTNINNLKNKHLTKLRRFYKKNTMPYLMPKIISYSSGSCLKRRTIILVCY